MHVLGAIVKRPQKFRWNLSDDTLPVEKTGHPGCGEDLYRGQRGTLSRRRAGCKFPHHISSSPERDVLTCYGNRLSAGGDRPFPRVTTMVKQGDHRDHRDARLPRGLRCVSPSPPCQEHPSLDRRFLRPYFRRCPAAALGCLMRGVDPQAIHPQLPEEISTVMVDVETKVFCESGPIMLRKSFAAE
jgi:hypothetical protein